MDCVELVVKIELRDVVDGKVNATDVAEWKRIFAGVELMQSSQSFADRVTTGIRSAIMNQHVEAKFNAALASQRELRVLEAEKKRIEQEIKARKPKRR
jgi:hypothetical protein